MTTVLVVIAFAFGLGMEGNTPANAAEAQTGIASTAETEDLVDLRALYLDAVKSQDAVEPAMALLERIRLSPSAGEIDPATLLAYEGAIISLRAKHGVWPHLRLKYLTQGLNRLDDAVALEPDNVEARYLRLLTCYFLPGFFGRAWSVDEDFTQLAVLLPSAESEFPPALFATMVNFVVESGRLQDSRSKPLEELMATGDG